MKSLSVIFTILLLVLASHLAIRLKRAGALPAETRPQIPPISQTASFSQPTGSLAVNPQR